MPELPEVETIRRGLNRFILQQEILSIELKDKKLVLQSARLKELKGDSITEVSRLGKLLIFSFQKNKKKLLIHLKMTGQLIFGKEEVLLAGGHSEKKQQDLPMKDWRHVRLQINFAQGKKLILNDSRRFAYVRLVEPEEFLLVKQRFGLEPLSAREFSFVNFVKLLEKRPRKNIKAFLLDQSLIAGIGNIYADEILFAAGVLPQRIVSSLKKSEQKKIFENTKAILKLAVSKRGTTFNDYRDATGKRGDFLRFLKVYGREGQKCTKCSGKIQKIRLMGRGTHYCSRCQF